MADDSSAPGPRPDPTQLSESAIEWTDAEDQSAPQERLGDFEILHEIGRGGMGIVYKARQISLDRFVALKVLPPAVRLSTRATERFEREARAAAKLHHSNIVPVHAIGEQSGSHFYAMELIEGQSLERILEDLGGGRPSSLFDSAVARVAANLHPGQATSGQEVAAVSLPDSTSSDSSERYAGVARLVAEVADGLHYAHGRGVIHRDIKPANLMLSPEGQLCVTDFGLARVLDEPGLTVSGSFMGTPAYMSPEQIAAGRMKLDHRTDVYSLGAVLYEMLTLRRPFCGTSREEVVAGIMTKDPRPPRRFNKRIPLDLETICLKAMDKDPDRRYQTAGEMAEDLRRYLHGGLIAARRASLPRRVMKSIRRHPARATVAAAAILLVFTGGLAWRATVAGKTEAARRSVADARFDMKEGLYREALTKVDRALVIDSDLDEARLVRAHLLMELGRVREAVEEAQNLLKEDPDDWTAHLVLATAARAARPELQLAGISSAEHVLVVEARAPETAEAYYLRSLLAGTAGEAVSQLDRVLELDPGHGRALVDRIHRHAELKDYPAALLDCERLIAVRPRSAAGRRLKAWLWREQQDLQRAQTEIDEAMRLDATDPRNFAERASLYDNLAKHEEALADRTRAIELDPDRAQHHEKRAEAHYNLGRFNEAIDDARQAVALNPDYLPSYKWIAWSQLGLDNEIEFRATLELLRSVSQGWVERETQAEAHRLIAEAYHRANDYEAALVAANHGVDLEPGDYEGLILRARIRQNLGDETGFDSDCRAAAGLDLEEPEDLSSRGELLGWFCNRWDLGFEDLDRIAQRFPNWHNAYRLRGQANIFMGDHEAALKDFTRCIELAPHDSGAYNDRAAVFDRLNRPDDSLADLMKAVELQPYNLVARRNLALASIGIGRLDEALRNLEETIALDPRQASPRVLRGDVLALLGDCEGAMNELRKAEELEPEDQQDLVALANAHVLYLFDACPGQFDAPSALRHAQKARAASHSGDAATLTTLGNALYRAGRYDEATEAMEQAVEIWGHSAIDSFFLAMSAWQQGNGASARSHYDRATVLMDEEAPNAPITASLRAEASRLLGQRATPKEH